MNANQVWDYKSHPEYESIMEEARAELKHWNSLSPDEKAMEPMEVAYEPFNVAMSRFIRNRIEDRRKLSSKLTTKRENP